MNLLREWINIDYSGWFKGHYFDIFPHCCPIKNILKPLKLFAIAGSAPSPRGEGWGEAAS